MKIIENKNLIIVFLILSVVLSSFVTNSIQSSFVKNKNDLKLINSFLKELKVGNSTALYKKHMFINQPGQPDRSASEIKYYTDTLFYEMKNLIVKNTYNVYPLSNAKLKFKNDELYDYYYDGQKETIYVLAIKLEKSFDFYYILTYKKKILSLMPSRVLDNGIIGWR